MDKRIASFLKFSFIIVFLLGLLIALSAYVYLYFTIDTYNFILIAFIIIAVIIIICFAYSMAAVIYTYKNKRAPTFMVLPVRLALKVIIPFTIFITGLLKKDKDIIRGLFVDINNILVESEIHKYSTDKVLVLLPHCLQYSNCKLKVTNDIKNCRRCGLCTIGDISEAVESRGVRAFVVTGGTAARNIIKESRPEIIISVACERDLSAGISDVSSIPVIGVTNERPNGPCKDTCVNVRLIEMKLDEIICEESKIANTINSLKSGGGQNGS